MALFFFQLFGATTFMPAILALRKYAPQILFCDSRQRKIVFILELKEKGLS